MIKAIKRLVYTHPDFLARFCKVNLSNAKNRPDFFLAKLIYGDQEPLWLLNVIEDDCCFFWCTYVVINSFFFFFVF